MNKTLRDTLIGTWKLIEFSAKDKDGNKYYPAGENAKGFIMYTPDGYMSAQIMTPGRKPYVSKDMFVGTTQEMAEAAKGYMAYSGKFDVEELTSSIRHHMEVSMNPTWLDQVQVRNIKVQGNRIIITTEINTAYLIWERTEDHSNNLI
ncbi:MAG: lipocalin-like domain-containing protein [Erysipelotrichales bacterium]|nr:lipocalin-like domain-containing protein [Erysipelotrichales bacterium]